MRWFRGHAEAPRLLSLSPLQADEDLDGASYHFHAASQYRDMSPVRWARRKSSSSESERNCYNVQTSQVTTERSPTKKNKKRIQEERRRVCEKRNPILDRVKNTRLSFFKDRDSDEEDQEDDEDPEKMQFRSMCELSQHGLSRNEFRRSVCESDLKEIIEEEKIQAKRKRRSKSQSRLPYKKHQEERFSFLGFRTSAQKPPGLPKKDVIEEPVDHQVEHKWRKSKEIVQDYHVSGRPMSHDLEVPVGLEDQAYKDGSQFDSITPSSCLAAKFRAMQDRYLKSSTSKLIAKIYKKDGKDRERRRLRSFSYGALPGLEELRTNPLYEEQDQDDNDSGILDNDSATSSLLDDRCSSSASGLLSGINDTSNPPPQLPPRKPSSSIVDVERTTRLFSSLDVYCSRNEGKGCRRDVSRLHALEDTTSQLYQAANSELIDRQDRKDKLPDRKNVVTRLESKDSSESYQGGQLAVIRNRPYITETMVVKLSRENSDQCLGIFIAKTAESSPGYLVAHVVPNGLADKEGTLRIGDEILIVNGKRLRGLNMAEARKILGSGSGPGEVDIVVSRYSALDQSPKKLTESSVDYENVNMENGHGIIVENSPRSHFRKHQTRHHRDRRSDCNRSISSEKSVMNVDNSGSQSVSNFCTLPRRPRNTVSTFLTVVFQKGPGKKSLGFTIVGGSDSPKGSIGIFTKSVLPGGQAAEDGRLRAGDEILAVNGHVCHDLTHRKAVQLFRNIKTGPVALHLCRRVKNKELQ
ncbi:PDZ domain-containing protein 2 [Dufourea novaeangliae]|uniref:PDZ domain-containing protein 2 n=2 Tax=Dufourea novaeangliae TaxID=178035 RepID=A0A154PDI6_DUFNO|nr:PDZ domain-containing protein 2 [Dufourea novaeangliae]